MVMDKYKEDFKKIYALDKQGLIDYIDRQEWMLDEDDSLGENDKLELITLIQTAKSRLTGSYEYVMNKRIKDGKKLRLKKKSRLKKSRYPLRPKRKKKSRRKRRSLRRPENRKKKLRSEKLRRKKKT